jgi:hypothetical protein
MIDWWNTSLKLQRDMLEAQKKSMVAADHLVSMQEAGRKAAEANLAAMNAWAKLWGIG